MAVDYNKIGGEGAKAIALALLENSTLFELWIYDNKIEGKIWL